MMVGAMVFVLGSILILIFVLLSGLHFYWAFGGKWGLMGALPTSSDGTAVLRPGTIATVIVGAGLLFFAIFYLARIGLSPMAFSERTMTYGGWIIPIIFLLRVIGDFRYVGLSKKVKSTEFARRDTKYFIPLCAFLSVAGFLVRYMQ